MKGRKAWMTAAAVAFAAAGGCIFLIWRSGQAKAETARMYEEMRQAARQTEAQTDLAEETDEPEETSAETETETEAPDPVAIPIDFETLQEMNPDICAWITVPGTDIDYPIVQREDDNSFYLTHSADGEESVNGAIFCEDLNEKDFSDVHTVLYGHNMKDGSMFAQLHRFEDEEFFDENKEIIVYTPDSVLNYRIFAAYIYDDRHLLQSFDCTDPDIFEAYVKSILEQRNLYSHVDEETEIGEDDRILTLSTCHSKGNNYRYLVQAVLEEELPGKWIQLLEKD